MKSNAPLKSFENVCCGCSCGSSDGGASNVSNGSTGCCGTSLGFSCGMCCCGCGDGDDGAPRISNKSFCCGFGDGVFGTFCCCCAGDGELKNEKMSSFAAGEATGSGDLLGDFSNVSKKSFWTGCDGCGDFGC